MATKKSAVAAVPSFTVQARLVLIADVEVEAPTLEDALALGRTWKWRDVVKLDEAASECDSKISVVGAWSRDSFSVE